MAVLRRVEPREALIQLVDELADAGVRLFEITLDAPAGADDLAAVRAHLAGRDCLVGAGTVLRTEQLDAAHGAGADFAVAPLLDLGLLRAAVEGGLPFVPGAMTPTEAAAAWAAGATFVKVFPASAVGPSFVRELRGPLPDVQLIPTGGIDAGNAGAFLAAGAAAVGIGSAITRATPEERQALVESLVAAS
jgi:2-dehydro-3-deoxyphosphogluconate aldolase/(4S)-4-hydroxy-2-oxoglutarate aldolase